MRISVPNADNFWFFLFSVHTRAMLFTHATVYDACTRGVRQVYALNP